MSKESDRLPSFNAIKQALECFNAIGTAAESHGLLCALLVTGAMVRKQAWVNSILTQHIEKGDVSAQDAKDVLAKLYDITEAGLATDNFNLQLLLPDDDVDIQLRIEALSEWCQGFLSGLNLVGINVENHSNPEVNETLQDMIKIATMMHQGEKTGDADAENNLVELIEYTRMAVVMINDEHQREDTKNAGVQESKQQH